MGVKTSACVSQQRPHLLGTTTAMAAVIVHGGAYAIPDSIADASVRGCQNAAGLAHRALREGKSAVDAGR